ncbi:MAG TPA: serine/threonine-protein kinase [Gemmatimonadales bacterium]|nr:serine/threonine-protein kinase [Gemmatimonadales bacterium]
MDAGLQAAVAGRYTVEREIARGGMATVHLARRVDSGMQVAIKLLRPEFARVVGAERFHREAAVLGTLDHPNILPLIESGQAGALPFYVMPYAEGASLRDRLVREPRLPLADVLSITAGVAAALDYAHAHNIIHRDIKPDNILFRDDRPAVSDFGIARAIIRAGGESLSSSGLIPGTPHYMSPEQAGQVEELDGRSDIYSLGCMIYEMLAGEPPFHGATVQAILARHIAGSPPSLRVVRPDVPTALERAVMQALAKQPAERPSNGAELIQAMTR